MDGWMESGVVVRRKGKERKGGPRITFWLRQRIQTRCGLLKKRFNILLPTLPYFLLHELY